MVPEQRRIRVAGDGTVEAARAVIPPQVPSGSLSRVLTVPPVPRAVQAARTWVRETLTGWGLSQREEDTQLATSELTTNAIRHAQDGASVSLLLMYAAGTLRLEVRDHDPLNVPLMQSPDDEATGGWGLHLVEQFTDRWGVRVSETGKAVWCEFDMTSPHPRRCHADPSITRGRRSDG